MKTGTKIVLGVLGGTYVAGVAYTLVRAVRSNAINRQEQAQMQAQFRQQAASQTATSTALVPLSTPTNNYNGLTRSQVGAALAWPAILAIGPFVMSK